MCDLILSVLYPRVSASSAATIFVLSNIFAAREGQNGLYYEERSPMAYWLFKEEPEHYSLDDLFRDKRTTWKGVANNLALKHLRSVQKGDLVLYYHTGKEKAVVGVMEVVKGPYPDSTRDDARFVVVDVKPVRRLPRPVSLAEIKSNPKFADFALVRISRLSVMPVTAGHWAEIERLSQQGS
jgi:predicted RNA-binding protein with PUA-like domain